MRELFSQFGEVVDARVHMDEWTGRSKGFGFVKFAQGEAVNAVLNSQGSLFIHEASVSVRPCQTRGHRPAGSSGVGVDPERIFVAGLPPSCTSEKLKEVFARFGEVIDAKVVMEFNSTVSKGFGYVRFQDANMAMNAVQQGGGIVLEESSLTVRPYERKGKDGGKGSSWGGGGWDGGKGSSWGASSSWGSSWSAPAASSWGAKGSSWGTKGSSWGGKGSSWGAKGSSWGGKGSWQSTPQGVNRPPPATWPQTPQVVQPPATAAAAAANIAPDQLGQIVNLLQQPGMGDLLQKLAAANTGIGGGGHRSTPY